MLCTLIYWIVSFRRFITTSPIVNGHPPVESPVPRTFFFGLLTMSK